MATAMIATMKAQFETWLGTLRNRGGTGVAVDVQDLTNLGDAVVMMMNAFGVIAESEEQTKPRVATVESSVANINSVTTGWIKEVVDKIKKIEEEQGDIKKKGTTGIAGGKKGIVECKGVQNINKLTDEKGTFRRETDWISCASQEGVR